MCNYPNSHSSLLPYLPPSLPPSISKQISSLPPLSHFPPSLPPSYLSFPSFLPFLPPSLPPPHSLSLSLSLPQSFQHLRLMRHPNIVKFLQSNTSHDRIVMVTEPVVPLHHALEGMNSEALVLGWRGVAIALHFLHSKVRLEAACVGGGRLCVCVCMCVCLCVSVCMNICTYAYVLEWVCPYFCAYPRVHVRVCELARAIVVV